MKRTRMLVWLLVALLAGGCDTDTIADTVTKEELDVIRKPVDSLIKVTVNSDAMLNYSAYNAMPAGNDVFLDKTYYRHHPIARGDIVRFQTRDARLPADFGRIIGLPGEEVHLKDGHIYIDAKQLDAFYGSEFREKPHQEKEPTSLKEPVTLEEDEYFVLGDYWSRSFNDSQTAGPLASSKIIGKVVGWEGPKTVWDYQQGIIVGKESGRVAIVREVSANALRVRSTEELINMAYPEALWANVDQEAEIGALRIGDEVTYTLIGDFELTTPLQAKATNFVRVGSVFD
ncbi:signal peptidase I [Paenibacillus aurantiacus]|uniref:Signal peptidase I n=1 Tax=Paenibacillus aurantiacus TaxID=1936118 RepID=A0ABV5KJ13_9BACL